MMTSADPSFKEAIEDILGIYERASQEAVAECSDADDLAERYGRNTDKATASLLELVEKEIKEARKIKLDWFADSIAYALAYHETLNSWVYDLRDDRLRQLEKEK